MGKRKGEKHPRAKLTQIQANQIRDEHKTISRRDLAKVWGI